MQDLNGNILDSLRYKSSEELVETLKSSLSEESASASQQMKDLQEMFNGEQFNDMNVPKIDTSKRNSVKEDIKEQKAHEQNKMKAAIFDTVFNNELQLYFDEHKHIMPSKERKRLKAILIKKISKGDIYINKVGKLIIRKGKNK